MAACLPDDVVPFARSHGFGGLAMMAAPGLAHSSSVLSVLLRDFCWQLKISCTSVQYVLINRPYCACCDVGSAISRLVWMG